MWWKFPNKKLLLLKSNIYVINQKSRKNDWKNWKKEKERKREKERNREQMNEWK